LQVLNQIRLVSIAEVQLEVSIVVIHHLKQSGEASIVKAATILMRPQRCQGAVRYT
jgi:hypothetical protein